MPVIVRASHLSKNYGDVEALKDVELEINAGEIAVLLGPNGSGKSTLMKIAAGVLFPSSGKLEIFGKEPYRDHEVKKLISYMPQDEGFYGLLTGYENYLFYAGIQGIPRKKAEERLEKIKEYLKLGDWFFKRKVQTYSGGMKRKTSLAVSISSNPKLLILDEPTTGLDPSVRRDFWKVLLRLKNEGKTVLMATHLFEDAEFVADKIIVMCKGRVMASSSPEELRNKIGYRYAIDIEFANEPDIQLLEKIKEDGTEIVFSGGFTVTMLCNEPRMVKIVEDKLENTRYVSFNLRRICLSDIYFLLTGVRLE